MPYAFYVGRPEECSFDAIANAQFEGAVSLNACRVGRITVIWIWAYT
ncbi:hypothetical protein I5Q83_34100 [Enterocloster clostridioformis]|nr:hypothetical protein [Enterocloster clostridioformis]QQR00715.1 hypothetical protein I5Q83_34100 [Enterocloster clostridioformis]